MDIVELLNTTPEELARKQYEALEAHVLNTLDTVKTCIKARSWDDIPMAFSPAGDDMGCDNYFIDFKLSQYGTDIAEVVNRLKELEKINQKEVMR